MLSDECRSDFHRWLAEGDRLVEIHGARASAAVSAARRAFFYDRTNVGSFVSEACEIDQGVSEQCIYERSCALYSAYEAWALAANRKAETLTSFGRRLSEMGFPVRRRGRNGQKFRCGIRVRPASEPLVSG